METWDIYNNNEQKTGRTITRGEVLAVGEYHLVVHIWIKNSKNQYLIQKRPAHLNWQPNIWATTGGSAIVGENHIVSAIREVKEELGLSFFENDLIYVNKQVKKNDITYVWLIHSDVGIEKVKYDVNEVSDVMWVDTDSLKSMIASRDFYNYGDAYFDKLWSIR